jgi:signal transduction histidine kinase
MLINEGRQRGTAIQNKLFVLGSDVGHQMKTYIWISIALTVLLVILALLLAGRAYLAPKKISDLARHSAHLAAGYQLSLNVERSLASVENYMRHADQRHLDDFRRYSSETIRDKLDLYYAVDLPTKNKVADLIAANRHYLFFVERELAHAEPAAGSKAAAALQSEHEYLATELRDKTALVITALEHEVEQAAAAIAILESRDRLLLFSLALLSLALLVTGLLGVALPLFVQYSHVKYLTDNWRNAVIITDRRGVVKKINAAAEKLLEVAADAVLNKSLNEALGHFPHLQNVFEPLFHVILHQQRLIDHQTSYTYAGRKTCLTVDYYPLFTLNMLTGAAMIFSAGERPENKRFFFESIETERKRLSIEIHDWMGRYMATMIRALDHLLRQSNDLAPGGADAIRKDLEQLRTHCQHAAVDMRNIMNEIHPYLVDKMGLIPALESYVSYFEKAYGIETRIYYESHTLKLETWEEIAIYRIVQEALTNVIKYSAASKVEIHFAVRGGTLKIEVKDNGPPGEKPVEGKGLWGMKERAKLLGGNLAYGYAAGGFVVTLTIPINWEETSSAQN